MPYVAFGDRRLVAGTPGEVWKVVSDPAVLAGLDDRLTLVSTSGDPGSVGSEYEMTMRGRHSRILTRTVVTGSDPGRSLSGDGFVGRRLTGRQRGELTPVDAGTRLDWEVSAWTPWLLGRAVARAGAKELSSWLDAVEREVVGRRG